MLYTRKGDKGTTGLYGTKKRLPKNSAVYDALGALDELNSFLGVCRAEATTKAQKIRVPHELIKAQQCLFIIQAELAGAGKKVHTQHVTDVEATIQKIEARITTPTSFVLSGNSKLSGLLDYARAMSRRVERAVLAARTTRSVSPETMQYLNRLSSLLYALARYEGTKRKKELRPTYENPSQK